MRLANEERETDEFAAEAASSSHSSRSHDADTVSFTKTVPINGACAREHGASRVAGQLGASGCGTASARACSSRGKSRCTTFVPASGTEKSARSRTPFAKVTGGPCAPRTARAFTV
jgi:hypothetical protein